MRAGWNLFELLTHPSNLYARAQEIRFDNPSIENGYVSFHFILNKYLLPKKPIKTVLFDLLQQRFRVVHVKRA